MDSFQQRIVKVVLPTLEAKAEWAEAAARDGCPDSVSAWVRIVVAKHLGGESKRLAQEASRTNELALHSKRLESELQLVRDAYEKARSDLQALSKRYETLSSQHTKWVSRIDGARAAVIESGLGLAYASANINEFEALQSRSKLAKPHKGGRK